MPKFAPLFYEIGRNWLQKFLFSSRLKFSYLMKLNRLSLVSKWKFSQIFSIHFLWNQASINIPCVPNPNWSPSEPHHLFNYNCLLKWSDLDAEVMVFTLHFLGDCRMLLHFQIEFTDSKYLNDHIELIAEERAPKLKHKTHQFQIIPFIQ